MTTIFSRDKFRWFAAETLVVVLGILIALSLDEYMSERQDRVTEIEYVKRLHGTVNADLRYVENLWIPGLRAKRNALEAVLPVVHGHQPVPDDVATFFKNVSMGGIGSATRQSWIADNVFRALVSTGNLRLINDPELRVEISRYYGYTDYMFERLRGRHTGYVAYVHSFLPAELRDDVDLAAYESFGIDFAVSRIMSDEFRGLANAEYNALLFSESLDFGGRANFLIEQLEQYLTGLGEQPDNH